LNNLNILVIIPARKNSKGIPGKNWKSLGGKPLITYTIESALEVFSPKDILVSTDSEEVLNVASRYNLNTDFLRPANLALDTTPTIDVVLYELDNLNRLGRVYDAVLLLQPTSPFRPVGFIRQCIEKFEANNYDSFVSVLPVPHEYNPHWVFEENNGELFIATGENKLIPRRQDLPLTYFRDGSVYITKVEYIYQNKQLVGGRMGFMESNPEYYCNLDTEKDWQKALNKVNRICAE
jgi:CMP-N,N'-diacetyllegionaminic acid synthase